LKEELDIRECIKSNGPLYLGKIVVDQPTQPMQEDILPDRGEQDDYREYPEGYELVNGKVVKSDA